MSNDPPRLRMFAGPNGSGKTTIKIGLKRPNSWFGIYINPDDLEWIIRSTGNIPLEPFGLKTDTDEIRSFFAASRLLSNRGLNDAPSRIDCHSGLIDFHDLDMNSYYASVLADFLRQKALNSATSFSFETVMSSDDKIELLQKAKSRGFRTYLYYVATEDPAINIERVRLRLSEGGHGVPEDKIISRYYRSLGLLPQAIPFTNRAFFFDTSEEMPKSFAEYTEGQGIAWKSEEIPNWFLPVWKQLMPTGKEDDEQRPN